MIARLQLLRRRLVRVFWGGAELGDPLRGDAVALFLRKVIGLRGAEEPLE
jgi:hypothetical protein